MGRPADVAALLTQGHDPMRIASVLGVSLNSAMGYLDRAVGEGLIRRSDIYFSFSSESRQEQSAEVRRYADARAAFGDMYDDIRRIEVELHGHIKEALVREFGDGESGWWRQGVPEPVRIKCQERRERDNDEPVEAFCYTDLLDLGKVIESQWNLLASVLPPAVRGNKRQLIEHLARLNRIRNKVMHPVRRTPPSEEDFEFVRAFERRLAFRSVA